MILKKFLLYALIIFFISSSYGVSKTNINFTEYYNKLLNPNKYIQLQKPQAINNTLPDVIDKDYTYDKKSITISGKTLNITEQGALTFKNSSLFVIKDSTINNKGNKPILFENSNLTGSKTNINTDVLLKNSILVYQNGYIKNLEIQGTANIAVHSTTFDTLKFNNLGATDPKIQASFNNITAKELLIDITSIKNDEDNKNNIKREYNIKSSKIEKLDLKGFINIKPPTDKEKQCSSLNILYEGNNTKQEQLYTKFRFNDTYINKVTYIDSSVKEIIKLPKESPGVFNFTNSTIENLEVSYNLLRNITFNGSVIRYLELKDLPTQITNNEDKDKDPNAPKIPEYNNMQLLGSGISSIENFNLNNAKELKIEGDIKKASYNAPISSICFKYLQNYENTQFSLYNLKEVNFGITNAGVKPKTQVDAFEPPMPQVPSPGGTNPIININYLHQVTTLGVYDNTIKFNWALAKNLDSKKEQYLAIYNLSNLNLINSLIDITETHKLQDNVRPEGITYDPQKKYDHYDIYFTYNGTMSTFGSIFNFHNSGAIKDNNRKKEEYIPIRLKVHGNVFTEANNMLSNLEMQLNGEHNVFTLVSNKNNKDYLFHTNYNYAYLEAKEGQTKPNANKLSYNYWNQAESQRIENNIYTFKCDMVIVDKGSKDYQEYKKKYGNKDYATTWFTYWQPYKVDKDGNPSKDGKPNKEEHKYGDQKAWDQGTDGKGRGGFPCEFGNKIKIENAKLTILKPLDNLTVLEVVGSGLVDFYDMREDYLKPQKDPKTGEVKRPQWITILRMRGGYINLAKLPLVIDKLDVYTYSKYNYFTLRPIFDGQKIIGKKATDIFDNQKLIINKSANFNNNFLKVDLYFNDYFLNLNQTITLNILELGKYKEKVKDKPEVEKQATVEKLEGILFDQSLLFDIVTEWKDNKLYIKVTRTKDFGYFFNKNNIDKSISGILDEIINKYSLNVDKEGKFQYLDKNIPLNENAKILINSLFKSSNKDRLFDNFASLRPINNETLFIISYLSTEKLLDSIKNSNNYTYESTKGKLSLWASSSMGSSAISNKIDLLGSNISNNTLASGMSTRINKFKIGAFLGYANNKFNSAYNSGDANQYGGGVYTDLNIGKGFVLKLSGIFTNIEYKTQREHIFLNATANAKTKGQDTLGSINFAKTFFTKSGFITSFISANVGYLSLNDYKEEGSSVGTMDLKGFSLPYYVGSVGLEYAKSIDIELIENSVLVPKIGIVYKYRYYNLSNTLCNFNKIGNNTIMKQGSNNYDGNSLEVNTGVNFIINYHSTITSNFNAELINKDITNYNFFIGYKYSF